MGRVWHWNRGNNKRGHVQLWNTPAGNVHREEETHHDMFKDGLTLHHFTKMALPYQVLEVMDPLLQAGQNEEDNANSSRNPRTADMQETKMECLISILRVGIALFR